METLTMSESFEQAIEELKRVEHLYYVSLKYTRTVDVLKNIINRMLNSFSYGFQALLLYSKSKGLITDFPSNTALQCRLLKEIFPKDNQLKEYIDFYLRLKKIHRANFQRRDEYRRHVTMIVVIDGETIEINIDNTLDYINKLREFIKYVRDIIYGKDSSEVPEIPNYF